MPLHLLGKKSWNVYNKDNIERVRRDEAIAKAADEAEEKRMQEIDSQRRIAILRGENPPPLEETSGSIQIDDSTHHRRSDPSQRRSKRKRIGEDDTDFELRLATERNKTQQQQDASIVSDRKPSSSAPIVDHAGHIDLFGSQLDRMHAEKNDEAEKELKKKKLEYEDQYTMRFSNAAGKQGLNDAWYSKSELSRDSDGSKDVFGNDDPKRKEREALRMTSDDPLTLMKRGASKAREVKKERKSLQEARDEELRQLRREQRRSDRRHNRSRSRSRSRERSRREHGDERDSKDRRRRHSRDRRDDDNDTARRKSQSRDHDSDRSTRLSKTSRDSGYGNRSASDQKRRSRAIDLWPSGKYN